jgi:hypothetical protein
MPSSEGRVYLLGIKYSIASLNVGGGGGLRFEKERDLGDIKHGTKCYKKTHCNDDLEVKQLVMYAITALHPINVDLFVRKPPILFLCAHGNNSGYRAHETRYRDLQD